jgi:hypothetical protein
VTRPVKRLTKVICVALAAAFAAVLVATYPWVRAHSSPHTSPCINNLRQIDGAKQQWAQENPNLTNHTLLWSDIQPYLGRGIKGTLPVCPQGGTYTLGKLGESPTCSYPKHVLE